MSYARSVKLDTCSTHLSNVRHATVPAVHVTAQDTTAPSAYGPLRNTCHRVHKQIFSVSSIVQPKLFNKTSGLRVIIQLVKALASHIRTSLTSLLQVARELADCGPVLHATACAKSAEATLQIAPSVQMGSLKRLRLMDLHHVIRHARVINTQIV